MITDASRQPRKQYTYIDYGYLRDLHESAARQVVARESTFSARKLIGRTTKSWIYYGEPQPEYGEEDASYRARLEAWTREMSPLEVIEGAHLRAGRHIRGRRRANPQKRVDVLLALDMLTHAREKTVERAILYAGDDDFTPVVEEIVRAGVHVTVHSHPTQGFALDLVRVADSFRAITFDEVSQWTAGSHLGDARFFRGEQLPAAPAYVIQYRGASVAKAPIRARDDRQAWLAWGTIPWGGRERPLQWGAFDEDDLDRLLRWELRLENLEWQPAGA